VNEDGSVSCERDDVAAEGGIGGSGTANHIPKFTSATTLGNSIIYEGDGKVGIGTTAPTEKSEVVGNVKASGFITGDLTFQKNNESIWRMFEDEDGLYLENLKTGKLYRFVLEEVER
jgi:hypothetical protein